MNKSNNCLRLLHGHFLNVNQSTSNRYKFQEAYQDLYTPESYDITQLSIKVKIFTTLLLGRR